MRAKLSFDEGYAEKPHYSIKAFTTEKDKGMNMMELIEDNFSISEEDRKAWFQKKLAEFNADAMTPTVMPKSLADKQVKFTRDDKGKIVSPFRSDKKLR